MKLGKKDPRHDPRTFRLARYMPPLPVVPPAVDWTGGIESWPMYQNDEIGDCTCAAMAHQIHAWTRASGSELVLPEDIVIGAYAAVGGYNSSDPTTDNGAVELDVLKWWRSTGIGGHKISAFFAVDPTNIAHFRMSVAHLGGCYIGLALPKTAQGQETTWSVAPTASAATKPGSWGGHAVVVLGYNEGGVIFVSWGKVMRMTWDFFAKYVDEAWAVLSIDFLKDGKSPDGLDITTLHADLVVVGTA